MTEPSTNRDVVVITGASTGIGRATALYLACKGLRVLAGVRKPSDGEALVAALPSEAKATGGSVEPLIIDVASGESITRAAAEVSERLGGARLAGLVNNVIGLVDTTQKLLPQLVRSRGRVVNVSSIGGRVATPMMGPYVASKFAVEGLTAALRIELRDQGVWAACVQPGMVKTEIWKKGDAQLVDQKNSLPAEAQARYAPLVAAIERFSHAGRTKGIAPEKVARTIEHALFAARPRMRYPVGPDARMLVVLQWLLPDRAFEWLVRKGM